MNNPINSITSSESYSRKSNGISTAKVGSWAAIAVLSIIFALSSWAVSSPIGSSPDDDYHLVSIWCGQGNRDGLCETGSKPGEVVVRDTLRVNSFCFASQPYESGNCDTSDGSSATTRSNGGENPPIFYWVTSWFASDDLVASVLGIRFFNLTLIVLLFTALTILLPKHLRRVPVVSFVVSSVPLGFFIIPSTNPSSWGIAAVLISFAALLGFVTNENKTKRILLGGLSVISMFMAAGSRPDSAFYILVAIGVVAILTFSKNVGTLRNLLIAIFLMTIAAYFFFTAGNTSATVSGAPGGGISGPTLGGTISNLLNLPDLWVGVFGTWGLGWLDTPLPSSVWAITYGIFFAVAFSAIRYFDRRQTVAASVLFLALVFVPMAALYASGLQVGQFIQPRYLLPLIGLLVAAAIFRKSESAGLWLSRGQIWIIGIGLFVANTISLHTNLRRYLTGLDENQVSLNFEIEWWWVARPSEDSILWFSPNYLWVFGSLSFGLFLISLWKLRLTLGLPGSAVSPASGK